jgi:menaquinone-dependent protoporphyrinogen oxidase
VEGELGMSRILVAYATKHGSTAEIADVIGEVLAARGHAVDVVPARDVRDVGPYDAVIVGSAVYMYHWQRDSMNLLRRHESALRQRPTWLFSSGPTGGSAEGDAVLQRVRDAPTEEGPLKEVAERGERIGIRGHATFAGKIDEGMKGFFARWIPKGDWRDFDVVSAWADEIGVELARSEAAPVGV